MTTKSPASRAPIGPKAGFGTIFRAAYPAEEPTPAAVVSPAARFGGEPKVIPGSLRRIALPLGLTLARVRATVEKHCGPGKPGLPPGLTEADLERERPTVTLDQLIAELNGELKEKRKSRFGGHDPVEDENLPPLVYYDAEQTLPKVPGGCTVLVIGPKSSHKTGLILKKSLDAIEHRRAKVLFIATEGAHGIRKTRLPAARRARGMSDETIRAHWRTEPAHFNLLTDRAELIEAYRDFNPDIVVLDVLAKSVPGNFNASELVTSIMTAADDLAAGFDATVIISTHPNKDSGDGSASGSVFFGALTFAEWHIRRQGEDAVRCWVDKMKDGPAEFAVFYKVNTNADGTPIIGDVTAEELREIERKTVGPVKSPEGLEATELGKKILPLLRQAAKDGKLPIEVRTIAEALVLQEHGNGASENDFKRNVESEQKQIRRQIGADAKPGPLYELAEIDRYGRLITKPAYRLRLPERYRKPAAEIPARH